MYTNYNPRQNCLGAFPFASFNIDVNDSRPNKAGVCYYLLITITFVSHKALFLALSITATLLCRFQAGGWDSGLAGLAYLGSVSGSLRFLPC